MSQALLSSSPPSRALSPSHASAWHPVVRVLHWVSVLVLVVCIAAVLSHEAFPRNSAPRAFAMQLHFALGGLLGLIALFRLAARLGTQAPDEVPMPAWMSAASQAAHAALYGLVLLLPVLGYVAASGRGNPIELFGWVSIPPLPVSKSLADGVKEVHEFAAWTMVAIVVAHAGAALYHALVLKDRVLAQMLGR